MKRTAGVTIWSCTRALSYRNKSYDPQAKVTFPPERQESGWLPIDIRHIGKGAGIAIRLTPGDGKSTGHRLPSSRSSGCPIAKNESDGWAAPSFGRSSSNREPSGRCSQSSKRRPPSARPHPTSTAGHAGVPSRSVERTGAVSCRYATSGHPSAEGPTSGEHARVLLRDARDWAISAERQMPGAIAGEALIAHPRDIVAKIRTRPNRRL